MNLFEKIFNYQILSKLEDTGTFMITTHERSWLKTMLEHPAAADAFGPDTLLRLQLMLKQEQTINRDGLLHKAASKELHVYHPSIRPIRKAISHKSLLLLSYSMKNGQACSQQQCFPYKLEYSMVKREWYLLWYHIRNRKLMSTKLQKIIGIDSQICTSDDYEQLAAKTEALWKKRSIHATIRVVREYNGELSRILYAYSCFEKEVSYTEASDEYTIRLYFSSSDSEFVLSKTRFLGKRVHIIESEHLRLRMLESATKALERYEADLG
ncbi:WYL domain-containing protein [Paenibacillus sp. FSL H8-0548]|uniref:WYL domain-containing protein n=1 Tax=Paenibacillus sp. FSL H8-0548 TaxID=1920422 RepID=UPI00096F7822|nr:WYL domain-containing protein [Paenibacillus sp. FSL H8-0548]OMF20414.1 WYL domain-containing protein [Paenibacillus sp. FSL H8-0548]